MTPLLLAVLAMGTLVVLLVVLLATRPARHFRRRLWPRDQDAAAGVGARP